MQLRNSARQGGRRGSAAGFTLIELMVTVAIMALLAAVAYPSYVRYTSRANRSAAESFMLEVSSRQERYLVDTRSYASNLGALSMSTPTSVSPHYNVSITNVTTSPPGYLVKAVPIGSQSSHDKTCGTLSLSSTGAKTASGSGGEATCWNR